ncbi:hypothetical protein D5086_015611 [Populus alba]|uniref:Uncharacterized protein n=1 Tax=Populus alba TaxID=43335 RepID=A0ACC4BRN5_POPAL
MGFAHFAVSELICIVQGKCLAALCYLKWYMLYPLLLVSGFGYWEEWYRNRLISKTVQEQRLCQNAFRSCLLHCIHPALINLHDQFKDIHEMYVEACHSLHPVTIFPEISASREELLMNTSFAEVEQWCDNKWQPPRNIIKGMEEKERSISSLELPCWRDYSGCWETNSRKWKAAGLYQHIVGITVQLTQNLGRLLGLPRRNGINLNEIRVLTPEDSESCESRELSQDRSKFVTRGCCRPISRTQKQMYQRRKYCRGSNPRNEASSYQLGHQLSLKWSTGAGPRIGCVADYPLKLREASSHVLFTSHPVADLRKPSASETSRLSPLYNRSL